MRLRNAWLLAATMAASCGGEKASAPEHDHEDADDVTLTASVRDKLESCGLRAANDDARAPENLVRDAYDRCVAHCHLSSSCDDVAQTSCDAETSAFVDCMRKCPSRPKDGYACADGTRIPHAARCDGDEDCRNGEDEDECKVMCLDGTELTGSDQLCDDHADCADGSDEADCLVCPEQ